MRIYEGSFLAINEITLDNIAIVAYVGDEAETKVLGTTSKGITSRGSSKLVCGSY